MRQQQTFHALGSDVALTIAHDQSEVYGNDILTILRGLIGEFEQRFSRFLPDSELTHFNQHAGENVHVSAPFLKLLAVAKAAGAETDGLYNPFVLPALQQAGYVGSWPQPETHQAGTDFSARKIVPVERVVIGKTWAQIPEGTAIDFGGIGKGYLLDQLADVLDRETLTGYLLSLGGDIICAGTDTDGQSWQVGVQNAVVLNETVETIINNDGGRLAIATSGVTKRRGVQNGHSWHHLVDPRTNKPVRTDILTATVTAASGLTADVYAKCVVIAGRTWADKAKTGNRMQSFLIQTKDASIRQTLEIRT